MKHFAAAFAVLAFLSSPVAADENAKTLKGTLTLFKGQKFDGESYRLSLIHI